MNSPPFYQFDSALENSLSLNMRWGIYWHMQIRRISFQGNDNPDHKFSDDYEKFCKSDTDWQEYIESPQINQMQLELLRRMRAMEGHESSAEPLTHERERKLSRGREEPDDMRCSA